MSKQASVAAPSAQNCHKFHQWIVFTLTTSRNRICMGLRESSQLWNLTRCCSLAVGKPGDQLRLRWEMTCQLSQMPYDKPQGHKFPSSDSWVTFHYWGERLSKMNSSVRPDEMEKTLSPGGPSAQRRMHLFKVQYLSWRQQQATLFPDPRKSSDFERRTRWSQSPRIGLWFLTSGSRLPGGYKAIPEQFRKPKRWSVNSFSGDYCDPQMLQTLHYLIK